MSNHLGTQEAIALLNRLKTAIQDFAAREEKISAEFRSRTAKEDKDFETASATRASQNADELAQAESNFQAELKKVEARYQQRKARISRGHIESRRRALDAINEEEGKRKYKVQEGTFNAEKRRDAELAAAAA
ncbi:MAG TPA: hypothetical protein VIV82_10480, partial [Verrucomicrobiae bacterium]